MNNKFSYKNTISKTIPFLIFLIIFSSISLSSVFGTQIKDIEISVDIGFNNFYEYESQIPINVKLKNNLRDINGKVQVLIPYKLVDKEVYTAYSKEISIAENSTKELQFVSLIRSNANEIIVKITDDSDTVIAEKEISIAKSKRHNGINIGVLSDDFESLNYFNLVFRKEFQDIIKNVNPDKVTVRATLDDINTNVVNIDNNMVENWEALQSFNIIIINNYNTEILTNQENKALEEWVNKGGLLLVGTGANHEKTLKGLGDLNYIQVTGLDEIKQINGDTIEPLNIIQGIKKSGNEILIQDNKVLVYNKSTGLGNVIIAGFDLGLNPFLQWEGKENFFRNILTPYITSSNEKIIGLGLGLGHNMLQYIPLDRTASLNVIMWIVIIFILLIGPINYIILKKLDRRELAWITIPAIVVLFSLFIYIWSFATRFEKPLSNNISTVMIYPESDKSVVNTTASVISFSNGDIDVSMKEGTYFSAYQFRPESQLYDVRHKFEDGDIILEYAQNDNKNLIFKKRSAWDNQFIEVKDEISTGQGIVHDLKIKDQNIEGSISNLTGLNIEGAVIIYNNDFFKIGDIDEGESKSLNFSLNKTTESFKGHHSIIQGIYPYTDVDIDYTDMLNDNVKREILFEYFHYIDKILYSDFSSNLLLIGWNREKLSDDIIVNNINSDRIDRNIIIAPLNISFTKGERVEIPHGLLVPKILEADNIRRQRNNIFYGVGTVTFAVKPNIKMELEEMEINITRGLMASDFEISLYNYKSNEWESYFKEILLIDGVDNVYYDEEEGTKIKLRSKQRSEIRSPNFSVKGVIK